MRILTGCLLSTLLACTAARGADFGNLLNPDIDQARFGWTGAYVGASGGFGWLKDIDYQFTPPLRDSGEDWVIGGHAGYLHQFGNFVLGAEASAHRLNIDYKLLSFITVESAYVLKARAGVAVDRWLLTGHAGGVYAVTNFAGLKDWGWEAGAGIDYALTDNFTIGAEYSHFGFKQFDGTQIDATVDLITARVGYKF